MLELWKSQNVGAAFGAVSTLVYNGYLYQFGGFTTNVGTHTSTMNHIRPSKIFEDGSLETAKDIGTMPVGMHGPSLFRRGDLVFVVGGLSGAGGLNSVYRYVLGPNGTISAATTCSPMVTTPPLGAMCAQSGDDLYFWRPTIGTSQPAVWYGKLTNDGVQGLKFLCTLPEVALISATRLIIYQNNLLVVGGFRSGAGTTAIWRCRISKDAASVSPWVKAGELPILLSHSATWIVDNTLIVAGGWENNLITNNAKAYSAKLDGDGNVVGPFQVEPSLVAPTATMGKTQTATHVYTVGGSAIVGGGNIINTVQYAKINRGR